MSGLALVAHALGASVTGSDRAAGSPVRRRAARRRDRARRRPRRRQRARRRRGRGLDARSRRTTPSAPRRASAACASCTARELLGELTRLRPTIAVTGTHGKTTTSSMLVHALRGCGMDPGYLVGGAVRSTGTNAGWGAGEWLVVEADESDRSLLKLAPGDRGAHQRRARPPHDLRLAARRRRDVPRVPRARRPRRRRLGPARSCSRSRRPASALVAVRRRDPELDAGRLALHARRRRGRADRPGRAQRPQRGGRADRRAARRAPTSRRPPPRCATSRAPAGASSGSGTTAAGALVVDDYAHHPTEVARDARGRPHARPAPRDRGLPAAPVLAHRAPGDASSAPRWPPPTRSSCSTSTPRASAPRTSPA